MSHWTNRSTEDLSYSLASSFLLQIEKRMERDKISRSALAKTLGVDRSYVTQLFNSPPNLTVETSIKLARAVGLSIALVAYDDEKEYEEHGPIHSEIFRLCWEDKQKPRDFWKWPKRRIEHLA